MVLITGDEVIRVALIVGFGSLAGGATLAYPGSGLWLLPATIGAIGCAFTVPEVRQEAIKSLPDVSQAVRGLLPGPRTRPDQDTPPSQVAQPGRPDPTRHPLFAIEDDPHRLIIGHTGGGKTTLMHALALRWAAEKHTVVVFDPDAALGQWPGCKVAGYGDDDQGIAQGVALVVGEVERRRVLRGAGQRTFKPVHIVIDEAHDVIADVPGALTMIEALARRGRKLGMHLTLGVQDRQVKTLGLDGKSQLLRNFRTVDVTRHGNQRVAIVHTAEGDVTIPVPTLPDPEAFIRPKPAPQPARPAPQPADDLLSRLLAGSLPDTGSGSASAQPRDTGTVPSFAASHHAETSITHDGRVIRIDVSARADVTRPPGRYRGRRRRPRQGPSVDVMKRAQAARTYQQIKALVAQGVSGNDIQKRVGKGRVKVQELVRRAKRELGR